MTSLEILSRSFREITFAAARASGVYLLLDGDRIAYVGASRNVGCRVMWRTAVSPDDSRGHYICFDHAIWYPLPWSVVAHYEGAFIRALDPVGNQGCPPYRGYDNEILEGFGLAPHADPEAVARRWHAKAYSATIGRVVPRDERRGAA